MTENCPFKYLVLDSKGTVVTHSAVGEGSYEGQHYDTVGVLSHECHVAIRELLRDSSVSDLVSGRARRMVRTGNDSMEISLLESIRLERTECNLKRSLSEWLFTLSLKARDAGMMLVVTTDRNVPERVLVDSEKIVWVIGSLVQNALHAVPRGMLLGRGGKVEVALSYDQEERMLGIMVQDDGGARPESSLEEASLHGPSGRMNGAGRFARSIIEAHGGTMVWENFSVVPGKQGTRVSVTIPVQ